MANKKKIMPEMDEWIWSKWQEGYTQKDIAKYLNVHVLTIQRHMSALQDEGRVLNRDGRHKKSSDTLEYVS